MDNQITNIRYRKETKVEHKVINKKHYQKITKQNLLKHLHESFPNETKKSLKLTFEKVFSIFEEKLSKREEITIANFGKLMLIRTDPHEKINPLTGEPVFVPAQNTIKFKTSKYLREKMTNTKWTGKYKAKRKVFKTITIEEKVK
ncbi:HU family DNA-binding protein [Mesoplasma seiffertii]|uniref:HU family DNA-binding protein n=1 Tax=Mesoplasma seiffertii TaxID=28224 RepID=UPI00055FA8B9|nr:HU family DNA-binding protein [Mesoplasma seiffertii]